MRRLSGLLALVALVACGPPPLASARASADDLARAVLDALARGDEQGLQRLALSESEFRAHVWPSLPAARPERNLPFSYVWGDLRQKSATFLGSTLQSHRDRRYDLVSVRYDAPVEDYAGFRVHRDAVFVVRRDASTATEEIRVCGSFLEKDGVWKVFSYVVDD